jgi:hypothetical protein
LYFKDDINFVLGHGNCWLRCHSHRGHGLAGTTSQKLLVFNKLVTTRPDFGGYRLVKSDQILVVTDWLSLKMIRLSYFKADINLVLGRKSWLGCYNEYDGY